MGPAVAAAAASVLVAFVLLLHSSYQKKIQRFQVWLLHQQLSLPLAVRQHEVQVSRWAMVVAVAGKEEVFHIAVAALVHLAFPTAAAAAAAVAMEGVDQDDHIAAAANPIAEVVAAAADPAADH